MAASSPPARRRRSEPMPRCVRPISASRRPRMANAPLLEVSNLETCYGLSQVLFGMSLAIAPGEMVTLMGRNGMGKTTTVRSIMGLTPAMSGSIRFGGEEIASLPSYRVAKLGVGLVPEGRQIFPNLTTRENLVATAARWCGRAIRRSSPRGPTCSTNISASEPSCYRTRHGDALRPDTCGPRLHRSAAAADRIPHGRAAAGRSADADPAARGPGLGRD